MSILIGDNTGLTAKQICYSTLPRPIICSIGSAGTAMTLSANEETRVMVVGGEPLGKRHIYWNFVSSSRERIEQAKSDWRDGKFDDVPGEHEFIPLPD